MKPSFKLLIFLFSISILSSCDTVQKPKYFDYGKIENNVYINPYFNFKMDIPPKWVVQDKKQTERLAEIGKKAVAGDDENLSKIIKASEVRSAILLTVFKHEIGTPVDFNPSIMVVVENVSIAPGIKNGADYLYQTRKLLKRSKIQYEYIDDDFEKVTINDTDFYRMNLGINTAGVDVKQSYYVTVKDGFAIATIITYTTEEEKKELEKYLNTIQFDN